ncbi:uncharacterized protein LOC134289606 [Aedes albopictus]|uniref:Peptidase aspartic putative domain-containing protein n=1 Tax=Aedes albopictus TaxID=7160 RepID=A0ABM1ZMZ2_AEDAL
MKIVEGRGFDKFGSRTLNCLHDEATERTSKRSRKTGRTTSSILAQRTELALQLLEEEKALIKRNREREDEFLKKEAEKQRKRGEEDAKLLKQKHDLLKSLEDGNGSIRSGISSNASRRRVQEWLGANSGGLVPVTGQQQKSRPTAQLSAIPSETSALPMMPLLKSGADVLPNQDAEGSTIVPKINVNTAKNINVGHPNMHVADLVEHLRNPMLVQELVERLPPQMRMQWSWYKRSFPDVNLATFGDFMTELVKTATDVTMPRDVSMQQGKSVKTGREKQNLYVYTKADNGQLAATMTKEPEIVKRSCAYCSDDGHEVARCPQFKALDLDGRWKAIRAKGLCRICLIPHRRWPCRSSKECGVDGCRFRHNALLHSRAVTESAAAHPKPSENVTRQNHHSATKISLFRYLPVTLEANGRKVETFAFLDDGSESTLMEAGLAQELDIVGPEESLWLSWTGNISREEKGSQRISVAISGTGLNSQYQLSNVRTVQKLKLQGQSFQCSLPLKVREGRANEPVAAKTRLGRCVYGKQVDGNNAVTRLHVHSEEHRNRKLHELMKQYFSIEEAAVATPLESEEDKRARTILERTTRRVDGCFETGLLWKYDRPSFPNNYPLAVRRMQSLEKRLAKEPGLKERVNDQIAVYESKGYAHRLTQEEVETTNPDRVWYLPLGIVRNPKKPQKIRLIWDAAARVHGVSFNDMLIKGPDMLTSLFTVLLRFRQRSVAVCGDIREMFHQVRIIPQDKQSQRFLYRDHPDQPPQVFVMDVATFGATCSPSSAQFVKNTNAQSFASQFPRAAEAIVNAHYVDDYLDSVDTIDEAVKLVKDIKFVHAQGGFDIRNFLSNSAEVLQRLGETENVKEKSMILDKFPDMERVLGMVWKPTVDVFTFDTTLKDDLTTLLVAGDTPTKRQV